MYLKSRIGICPKCLQITLKKEKGKTYCTDLKCDFSLILVKGKKLTFWDHIKC